MLLPNGKHGYSNSDIMNHGAYIVDCLSERQMKELHKAWVKAGGVNFKPWYQFVIENTKVCLDIGPLF